jgi:acetyl-CoA carboxylase carboxyltransferase component
VQEMYQSQTDIRYGAARGWVDAIIAPESTRLWLSTALSVVSNNPFPANKQAREV